MDTHGKRIVSSYSHQIFGSFSLTVECDRSARTLHAAGVSEKSEVRVRLLEAPHPFGGKNEIQVCLISRLTGVRLPLPLPVGAAVYLQTGFSTRSPWRLRFPRGASMDVSPYQ